MEVRWLCDNDVTGNLSRAEHVTCRRSARRGFSKREIRLRENQAVDTDLELPNSGIYSLLLTSLGGFCQFNYNLLQPTLITSVFHSVSHVGVRPGRSLPHYYWKCVTSLSSERLSVLENEDTDVGRLSDDVGVASWSSGVFTYKDKTPIRGWILLTNRKVGQKTNWGKVNFTMYSATDSKIHVLRCNL